MVKKLLAVAIIILFIGMSVAPSTGTVVEKKSTMPTLHGGNTLYVGGSGPGNYSKIQDAIDNASNGDTVFVYNDSSPYYEQVIINKMINLIGEDKNTTIIDSKSKYYVVSITFISVRISGFTIQNSGSGKATSGIRVDSSYNCIKNNIIKKNNDIGIWLSAPNNNISDNDFYDNSKGIGAFSSSNIIIDNNFTNNSFGILQSGSSNTIVENKFTHSIFCIYLSGSSKKNIISRNYFTRNNNGVFIMAGSDNTITNNTITSNSYGIRFEGYSNRNNIISRNTITGNRVYGILMLYSPDNNIIENSFINNKVGICILGANKNKITGNNIKNNINVGIRLEYSDKNLLRHNNLLNNTKGIVLSGSNNNTIVRNNIVNNSDIGIDLKNCFNNSLSINNFLNNGQHAKDTFNNIWYSPVLRVGNYWDDYEERYPFAKPKLFRPWIWDTPYEIPGGNNTDNYPLVKQWPDSISKISPYSQNGWFQRWIDKFPLLNRLLNRFVERWNL